MKGSPQIRKLAISNSSIVIADLYNEHKKNFGFV